MGKSGGIRKMVRTQRVSVLLGMITGVAACAQVEIGAHAVKSSSIGEDEAPPELSPVSVQTDAEGYALWTGFRSDGGAWVAHPTLPAPGLAYVRNAQNGRVIEARILRRNPDDPGPRILLSGEAANKLEIGPHRLTKVQIEVISDEQLAADPADAAPVEEVVEAELAPVESAAPSAVEPPATPADAPVAVAALETGTSETAPPPQVLAEIPSEPAPLATTPAPQVTAPAETAEGAGVFRGDAAYDLGGQSGGGDLSAVAPEPAPAPVPAPQPKPAASAPAEPAPAQPVTTSATRSAGQFVQVVSFTAESSAAQLATRLNALGHPTFTDSGLGGETRWHRVLIGPLEGQDEIDGALAAADDLGYSDAFVTQRTPSDEPTSAPQQGQAAVSATPAPTPEPAPAPAPAPEVDTAGGPQPYVQVGSFTVEDNAAAVASKLTAQGLPTFTDSGLSGERRWHRVLIGPLPGAAERERALEAAKALGHSDAFVTRF